MNRPYAVENIFKQFMPSSMLENATLDMEQQTTALAMKWITYSYPCLPCDELAHKVRKEAWDTIETYAKTLGIKVSPTLDTRIIQFFNELTNI